MSTLRTVHRGPQPGPDQIARAVAQLVAKVDATYRHAYTCGVLEAVIDVLAELHASCRKRDCGTCRALRSGLAALAALDEITIRAIGGASHDSED
jgi:ferredoxin